MDATMIPTTAHGRLRAARIRAGFKSARSAALECGWPESTYRAHETGTRNFSLQEALKYGNAFNVSGTWIWNGDEIVRAGQPKLPVANATIRRDMVAHPTKRINILGRAAGSASGEIIMSGEVVDTFACPPNLEDVLGAYAVYVVGESMEPRYYAGEVVFVHPSKPYRRHSFVVVQVNVDGEETPRGFVKQFVSMSPTTLTLCQLNPPQELEFAREDVISIHRIVGSSES